MAKTPSRSKSRGRSVGGAGGGGLLFVNGSTIVTLTNDTIAEGSAAATVVGVLDANPNIAVLTLLDNAGGLFAISGSNLVVAETIPLQTVEGSYNVTVRAVRGIFTNDTVFNLAVEAAPPTAIALTPATIPHTHGQGGVVGTLTSTPAGATFALTNTDGNKYEISGAVILAGATPLAAGTDTIGVTATLNGHDFVQNLTITVT